MKTFIPTNVQGTPGYKVVDHDGTVLGFTYQQPNKCWWYETPLKKGIGSVPKRDMVLRALQELRKQGVE